LDPTPDLDTMPWGGPFEAYADRHVEETAVERYAMGSLQEDAATAVEHHLLLCEVCRGRVTEAEAYIRIMKRAARELPADPPRRGGFRIVVSVLAGCGLLLLAGAAAIRFRH